MTNNLMRGGPGQMSGGASPGTLIYTHNNQIRLQGSSNLHDRVGCEVEVDQKLRIKRQIHIWWNQFLEPGEVTHPSRSLLFDHIRARVPVRADVEEGHRHHYVQQDQPRIALPGKRDGIWQRAQGSRPEICGE